MCSQYPVECGCGQSQSLCGLVAKEKQQDCGGEPHPHRAAASAAPSPALSGSKFSSTDMAAEDETPSR